jgi:amino acid transporter
VSIGAILGMISSLLVFQYGQARIWFAMSRDGLLPKAFSGSIAESMGRIGGSSGEFVVNRWE